MSVRNRLIASNMLDSPRCNRLATPQSSLKAGARQRAGGDGDGGTAIWKSASSRQEKSTIASTLRAASIRNKASTQKITSPRKGRLSQQNGDGKVPDRLSTIAASKQTDRTWAHRKTAGGVSSSKKVKLEEGEIDGRVEDQPMGITMLDTGIQTNEAEIMNRELLVGDIKLLMPSAEIAKQIDKMRWEGRRTKLRETRRKFASHEQDEELHLDELKEFMERSYVTKRSAKKSSIVPNYDSIQHRNVFKSMDEFFTREIPKAESVTNIQERIKRKEAELMSMFDQVDVREASESESLDE